MGQTTNTIAPISELHQIKSDYSIQHHFSLVLRHTPSLKKKVGLGNTTEFGGVSPALNKLALLWFGNRGGVSPALNKQITGGTIEI